MGDEDQKDTTTTGTGQGTNSHGDDTQNSSSTDAVTGSDDNGTTASGSDTASSSGTGSQGTGSASQQGSMQSADDGEAQPVTPAEEHDGTSSTANRGGKLSPLITQAVATSNAAVIGDSSTTLNGKVITIEGGGMAYQKAAQAAAISVQDSSDYMRNIMAIASTAQGVALKKMIETKSPEPWSQIMTQAQAAVTAAQKNLADVGTSTAQVVNDFEKNV